MPRAFASIAHLTSVHRTCGPALRALAALLTLGLCQVATAQSSLRYFGGPSQNQVDRVKIQIDEVGNNNPGPPVDVGNTDFTVELFLKAPTGSNPAGGLSCGDGSYSWINGNIFLDRNRYGQGSDYGLALGDRRVYFGIRGRQGDQTTICGSSVVVDDNWHHIAVQRRRSDGHMWLYVDGVLEDDLDGPDGDISYPDDSVPQNSCGGPCTESDPFLVLGVEKHDQADGFNGWLDELRVSTVLRYPVAGNFSPPTAPFDGNAPATAALYHFDEGVGDTIIDSTPGNLSPGQRYFGQGGGAQPGPIWTTDTPFSATPGSLQFSAATTDVNEGAGSAVLNVTRSGGSSGAASVSYQITGGTATSGADYAPLAAGTLNWADNDGAPKQIPVAIINDTAVEATETIVLQLSNASGATLGATTATTVSIIDNDGFTPGVLQFSVAAVSVSESAATVTLNVTRTGGSDGAAAVNYQIAGGTATAGADYTPLAAGRLNWEAGDAASRSITIDLLGDTSDEPDETITLQLSNATGATLGAAIDATITINDDDAPSGGGGDGGGGGAFDWLVLASLAGTLLHSRPRSRLSA